jgi:hypothetical protein
MEPLAVFSIRTSLTLEALELRIRLRREVPSVPLPKILQSLTPRVLSPVILTPYQVGQVLRITEAICRRTRIVPDTCLYRALTRYALLRRAGYAAEFVMGMNPRPRDDLTAHAWVELNGVPYRETLDAAMVVNYVYPDDRSGSERSASSRV